MYIIEMKLKEEIHWRGVDLADTKEEALTKAKKILIERRNDGVRVLNSKDQTIWIAK